MKARWQLYQWQLHLPGVCSLSAVCCLVRRQWQLPRKCNIFPARVTGAMGTLCPIHAQHSCRQTCQQCMMVFVMERMHLHPCTQLVWQVSFDDIFWGNLVRKYLLKSYFLLDTFNTYSESAKCWPVDHTQNLDIFANLSFSLPIWATTTYMSDLNTDTGLQGLVCCELSVCSLIPSSHQIHHILFIGGQYALKTRLK